ncbi:MAG: energy-coupling factor transporter ATPase [Eubacteriales bacterium]|nr:energy-coupling factor transporter ATPase [Eubacteriales bacterium]
MIQIKDLAFEYFDRDDDGNLTEMIRAIRGICFDAKKGDFIAIAGKNGSGKSTFAKILNRLLVPIEGTILIGGLDAMEEKNTIPIRKQVGMVFQNPDDQLIGSVVAEDVAFGAENLGVPGNDLWQRVTNAVEQAGLSISVDKRINELSGGERQKVAIAGVLAMQPSCIVLDEATSMLDPKSRQDILNTMKQLNEDYGITIIMITHRMEELLFAKQIFIMHRGHLVMQGRKEAIFSKEEKLLEYGLECPAVVLIAKELYRQGIIRTDALYTVSDIAKEIYKMHRECFTDKTDMPQIGLATPKIDPVNAVLIDHVSFSYGKRQVLSDISLSVKKGEYVVLMGATGSGKSTLLQMIPALLKPDKGTVYVDGRDVFDRTTNKRELRSKIGYVFQYPEHQLFAKNVYEDVVFGPRNIGVSEIEAEKRAYESIELVGLPQDVYDLSMDKLSGGQKRRVALAGVLAMKPEYLILDEPFAGLDPKGKREMQQIIDILHKDAGITIFMVSHDAECAWEYADRIYAMQDGKIVCGGRPDEVFYHMRDELANLPAIMQLLVNLREMGLPVNCAPLNTDGILEICNAIALFE